MKSLIKAILPRFAREKITHLNKQKRNFCTLAKGYGQYQSIVKWSAEDATGAAIPWYTYPAIEYLRQLDFSECAILEYGSGNSSNFWARNAKKVVSIESDRAWFEAVAGKKLPNQEIYFVDEDSLDFDFAAANLAANPAANGALAGALNLAAANLESRAKSHGGGGE